MTALTLVCSRLLPVWLARYTPFAPTPAPKKTRKRKQAIVLEVSQDEAERAADAAEAMIAETNDETAA